MLKILIAVGLGSMLALPAIVQSHMLLAHNSTLLPQAFRFLVAAFALGVIQTAEESAFPTLSIKLLNSAAAAGVFFMALPAVLWMYSMKTAPPFLITLAMSLAPLWIYSINHFKNPNTQYLFLISTAGFVLAAFSTSTAPLSLALILSAIAMTAMAGYLARHLFWIHMSVNLNFWSMLVAAIALFPLGFMFETTPLQWEIQYWALIGILGLLLTAGAAYSYRKFAYRLDARTTAIVLVLPTAVTIGIGLFMGVEKIPSGLTLLGIVLALLPVAQMSRHEDPRYCLTHFLTSSNRVADRIDISLRGHIQVENGPAGNIRVKSISVGGLGFESDVYCPVTTKAVVKIPLGTKHFTQVLFDTVCAYTSKIKEPGEFSWKGGLAFQKMDLETTQILAEFVARMGYAHRDLSPKIEAPKVAARC
jgi:drug/metabolite transporter (DMT)-like permease